MTEKAAIFEKTYKNYSECGRDSS
ncbi:hypothetical protein PITCH_A1050006 [uncultured Desulfobacterium sp.]|uniref:Uncharacterized protein n=1 Tax=uncultured Desulfobacterium sp. TaxID=201089 RepID=A0A445MQT1_9BACT|nr:hypothetical protein PITCH_A1050006 [uncultured Desulfobacterium sp.]